MYHEPKTVGWFGLGSFDPGVTKLFLKRNILSLSYAIQDMHTLLKVENMHLLNLNRELVPKEMGLMAECSCLNSTT